MQLFFFKAFARLLSMVPLRLNHQIGAGIGLIAWHSRSSLRRVSEVNLSLCFPDWTDTERKRIAHRSMIETGKALTEAMWLWHRPVDEVLALVQEAESYKLLKNARASGHGLLLATPHIGSWELCNAKISAAAPLLYFYQSPRNTILEEEINRGRANLGGTAARLDRSGIRSVMRSLNNGGTVGILPDQEPEPAGGIFASFFGIKTNTMTLFAKLACKSNATVLFCFAERLPKGAGWRMHCQEPVVGISDKNLDTATQALNSSIENCVCLFPEQYLWNYKRFRQMEDGSRRPYKLTKLPNH